MRVMVAVIGLCSLSHTLAGQSVTFGVKAGPNSSRQVGWCCGESNPFDSRTGLTGGVTASVHIRGPLAFQTELLYAGKGVRGIDVFQMRLHYLEIPLLLRLAPSARHSIRPVVLLGAAPAFELSCTGRTRPPSIPESPAPVVPLNCSAYRTTASDVGLVGAFGAELRLASLTWTAEARYTHGIGDLTAEWNYVRTTNRSLALLFGIRVGQQ